MISAERQFGAGRCSQNGSGWGGVGLDDRYVAGSDRDTTRVEVRDFTNQLWMLVGRCSTVEWDKWFSSRTEVRAVPFDRSGFIAWLRGRRSW